MKKAALVMATLVAFLLSGPTYAARKYVDMPSTKTIFGPGSTATSSGGVLKVSGQGLSEIIPSTSTALTTIPAALVDVSSIGSLAKTLAKGGAVGIAGSLLFDEMLHGVDLYFEAGRLVKQQPGAVTNGLVSGENGEFYWSSSGLGRYGSASSACQALGALYGFPSPIATVTGGVSVADCRVTSGENSWQNLNAQITRFGSSCPAGSTYNTVQRGCAAAGTKVPAVDSDLTLLDGFIKGKDGTWQRDLTNEMCAGSENCFAELTSGTQLSGPATIAGKPTTQTTTSSSGATTTTTTTPTTALTYGNNYYDYTTTTTTTTNNGGDTTTTTDDTDISMPTPPNIFGPANGGLGGILDDIPKTSAVTTPIPYMAWWSFSQSCSEITFVIPIYGAVTTKICPIYEQYIWPVLYFFFAVFTWLHCFQIWRGTVMRVRAS